MTLIHIRDLSRKFMSGDEWQRALDAVSLTICRGEMVAITGPSGSGKSTLLNILGCLDMPDEGSYRLGGTDITRLDHNQLATLRRLHLGFIFQRYYLLDDLNVAANISLPTVYAGQNRQKSLMKAGNLLHQFGLGDRLHARPSTLSGGQQQRVCIARALINDAKIILADEPTGALDARSAEEVMTVLTRLHTQGHTVIIVTHDKDIARRAERVIQMNAGRIIADSRPSRCTKHAPSEPAHARDCLRAVTLRQNLTGALHMAVASLRARKLRTLLTLSGVVLGITAVSTVVAIGNGAKQQTLESINGLGTNVVTLYDERNNDAFTDVKSTGLTPDDAIILMAQPWSNGVSPEISVSLPVGYRAKNIQVMTKGIDPQWFSIRGYHLTEGRYFEDSPSPEPEVVISQGLRDALLQTGDTVSVGDQVQIGHVPLRVTGIVQGNAGQEQRYPEMWVHWRTAEQRITGNHKADSIILRLKEGNVGPDTLDSIIRLITLRHGVKDFSLFNADSIRRSAEQASLTLRLLILMIGLIALLTGMVGVMNIMLVSVSERTHEIGVRMATGARRTDILQQFLLEAVLICLSGGVLGILCSLAIGPLLMNLGNGGLLTIYSWEATGGAFLSALLTGLMAGYLPARKAARMNPVTALAGV